jgi:alkylation response protein AidB-like acyl-CoA dehydrogenase
VDFNYSDVQQSWKTKADLLGRDLAADAPAADVIMGAARVGLIDPRIDLLSAAVAVEALAAQSAGPALAFALHTSIVLSVAGDDRFTALARGEVVAGVGLSSDDVAEARDGQLSGRASWVGPLTDHGVAILGTRARSRDDEAGAPASAVLISLDSPGVSAEPERTAALRGFVCGHVALTAVPYQDIGSPLPIMARVRILLAAAGLGMGKRALREALQAARSQKYRGAGGEQTVQGLLADAATELDAAMMLTWKAATAAEPSLADASMAKLAATEATQGAVARATQVVGAESFRRGHVIERLAQDVRALELFAGRTEALRDAVAEATLPRV